MCSRRFFAAKPMRLEAFAREVGAGGYASDASLAVRLAKSLLGLS